MKIILIVIAVGILGNLVYMYGEELGHEFGHWWYGNSADHID